MTCPLCFSESDQHGYFMNKPCPRTPKPSIPPQGVKITLADPNRVFEEYVERAEQHELERIWEEEHSLKPKPTTRELAREIVQRRRQVEALQKLWRKTPY